MVGAIGTLVAISDEEGFGSGEEYEGEYLYVVCFKSEISANGYYNQMRGAAENEPSMILRTYGKYVLYGTESLVNKAIDSVKG